MAIVSYTDQDGHAHWPNADVGEIETHGVDWGVVLTDKGATISTITWTVPTGLEKGTESIAGNVAKVVLTCGTPGDYKVKCQLDASDGSRNIQIMNLKVV